MDFLDCSYGYRPGRTQHQALDQLARTIQQRKINFIVEADIKGDLKPADRFYSLKDVDRSVARQNPLPGSGESKSRSWRLRDSWPLAFMIPLLLATEWLIHRLKL